jgi:hypothetical protein
MAYTDLFNEAIDDLTASLTAVSGLRVVNDATKSCLIACSLTPQVLQQLLATAT